MARKFAIISRSEAFVIIIITVALKELLRDNVGYLAGRPKVDTTIMGTKAGSSGEQQQQQQKKNKKQQQSNFKYIYKLPFRVYL